MPKLVAKANHTAEVKVNAFAAAWLPSCSVIVMVEAIGFLMHAALTVAGQPAAQVDLFLAVALDTKAHIESFALQAVHLPDLSVA